MKKRNFVIQVNKKGKKIKIVPKLKAHLDNGILHRAIAVFIFNKEGDILIQRRSKEKMLWPLYWDMACASHPFEGESYLKSAKRRLKEELGFSTELKLLGDFYYQAKYKDIGIEKEICGVLVGQYHGEIKPNKKEVTSFKWVDFYQLKKDIKKNKNKYTPWLEIALEKYNFEILKYRIEIIISKIKPKVEKTIKKIIASSISDKKLRPLIEWQIKTGGKRIRPFLSIISSRIFGSEKKEIYLASAGLEILHNYTLIIDDIIDKSLTRRSLPTLWKKYGKSMAQCIAMDYAAIMIEIVSFFKNSRKAAQILSKALKEITEGEILDILFEQAGRADAYIDRNRKRDISLPMYFNMIGKKTASLFEMSCFLGAEIANAKPKQMESLKKYGYNLGLVFQITDDILDIFGKEKIFGKKIGKDVEEHKGGNIVTIFALKEFTLKDKKSFLKILRKDNLTNEDIKLAISLIRKTNAKKMALEEAKKYSLKAKTALSSLPDSKWKNILIDFVEYVEKRTY